jgi:NAD(P)-dependent dehydrogenase (short-subunit alcohol dehydrogenase family)
MNTVLITGANRGIGLKLVEHYCEQQHQSGEHKGDKLWQVYATYRDEHHTLLDRTTEYDNLTLLRLDVSDSDSIAKLQRSMTGITVNVLINNAGVHGDREHSFGHTNDAARQKWHDTFSINTIAPMMITEAMCKNLQFGAPAKVAFITSKMGSIMDNSSGGSYIYRSSKAALNAIVKSLSFDLLQYHISVVAIHPGWVKTRMGGENALIDTHTSVNGITTIIDNLAEQQSGQFVNYDGTPIPW